MYCYWLNLECCHLYCRLQVTTQLPPQNTIGGLLPQQTLFLNTKTGSFHNKIFQEFVFKSGGNKMMWHCVEHDHNA
jgi:hypothetical protein